MEIPQLYKVVRRYPIWENANLDYIYYPRFSINLIVIRIECTLENLEILLFGAQTRFKIVIFTREGLIPRHLSAPSSVFETLPLSTQVCLNIVNCFTDATRGLKAKKAPTNSLFVGTTARYS